MSAVLSRLTAMVVALTRAQNHMFEDLGSPVTVRCFFKNILYAYHITTRGVFMKTLRELLPIFAVLGLITGSFAIQTAQASDNGPTQVFNVYGPSGDVIAELFLAVKRPHSAPTFDVYSLSTGVSVHFLDNDPLQLQVWGVEMKMGWYSNSLGWSPDDPNHDSMVLIDIHHDMFQVGAEEGAFAQWMWDAATSVIPGGFLFPDPYTFEGITPPPEVYDSYFISHGFDWLCSLGCVKYPMQDEMFGQHVWWNFNDATSAYYYFKWQVRVVFMGLPVDFDYSVYDSGWKTLYFTIQNTGNNGGGGGGGGGCVATGTPILLKDGGYVPVEELEVGDKLLGYDVAKGKLQHLKVESVTSTQVDQILTINDGLLKVTPTDQPIYMRNDTFEGWLADPQDLQVGDMLFEPVQGAWIEVTSLVYDYGGFTVYDVQTSGTNTFIANGILLDAKEL